MDSDIRFQMVFQSIRDLQTEKVKLEDTLKARRQARMRKEESKALVAGELLKVRANVARMSEALSVGRHKLTSSNIQQRIHQEMAEKKNEYIKHQQKQVRCYCTAKYSVVYTTSSPPGL